MGELPDCNVCGGFGMIALRGLTVEGAPSALVLPLVTCPKCGSVKDFHEDIDAVLAEWVQDGPGEIERYTG